MSKEQEILHEALHMSRFLNDAFFEEVRGNREVQDDEEMLSLAIDINERMWEMYQLIGRKMCEMQEKEDE